METDKKNVVFLSGYSYELYDGTLFSKCFDRRINYLKSKWSIDWNQVTFTAFDVMRGSVSQCNGQDQKWKEEKTLKIGSKVIEFRGIIRDKDYGKGKSDFKSCSNADETAPDVMSIVDVYKFIEYLGEKEPGSLLEFSIFSHSYFEGPILVNSYRREGYDILRDPCDKDGRAFDFSQVNMTKESIMNFRKAFAPRGFIWVWGCNYPTSVRSVFKQLYVRKLKSMGSERIKDSEKIKFSFNMKDSFYDSDLFFPSDKKEKTFERTFLDVKKYFMRALYGSYCGRTACCLGNVDVRGALTGTYSERSPDNLFRINDGEKKLINFYKTYLEMPLDPEGRGFGVYSANKMKEFFFKAAVG